MEGRGSVGGAHAERRAEQAQVHPLAGRHAAEHPLGGHLQPGRGEHPVVAGGGREAAQDRRVAGAVEPIEGTDGLADLHGGGRHPRLGERLGHEVGDALDLPIAGLELGHPQQGPVGGEHHRRQDGRAQPGQARPRRAQPREGRVGVVRTRDDHHEAIREVAGEVAGIGRNADAQGAEPRSGRSRPDGGVRLVPNLPRRGAGPIMPGLPKIPAVPSATPATGVTPPK